MQNDPNIFTLFQPDKPVLIVIDKFILNMKMTRKEDNKGGLVSIVHKSPHKWQMNDNVFESKTVEIILDY